jgi:FkbM family methyltransferase
MCPERNVHAEHLRVVKTRTAPSFLMVTDAGFNGGVAPAILESSIYAPAETAIFKHVLSNSCSRNDSRRALVVDVGANLGYFSLYALSHGCRVLAIEAASELASVLNHSVRLNGWGQAVNDFRLFVNPVSNMERKVKFAFNKNHMGLSRLSEDGREVDAITLDNVLQEDVLLLKMDVEGAEDLVFKGMLKFLAAFKVSNLVLEIKQTNDIETKRKFINGLLSQGFRGFLYLENYEPVADIADHVGWDDIDKLQLVPLSKIPEDGWIPSGFEDVWFTKNEYVPKGG